MVARPIVIVNCKTYPQATGKRAIALAKVCERIARERCLDVRIAVQAVDLALVARAVRIPVYAQHIDDAAPGMTTGSVTAAAIKAAGARGALLNHAERPLTPAQLGRCANALRREKLEIIACVHSVAQLRELGNVRPSFFVLETPELIGGETSVSTAHPSMIIHAVQLCHAPLLIGAGIKDANDLRIALVYGCKGVLLSSHVVLAKNQRQALLRLVLT